MEPSLLKPTRGLHIRVPAALMSPFLQQSCVAAKESSMIIVGPEDFQIQENNNIVDTMFTYIHIIIIILIFSVLFFQQRMQIFLFEKKTCLLYKKKFTSELDQ